MRRHRDSWLIDWRGWDLSRNCHRSPGTEYANCGYSTIGGKNALLREDFRGNTLVLELVVYAGKLGRPDLSPLSFSSFDNRSPHHTAEQVYHAVDVLGGSGCGQAQDTEASQQSQNLLTRGVHVIGCP